MDAEFCPALHSQTSHVRGELGDVDMHHWCYKRNSSLGNSVGLRTAQDSAIDDVQEYFYASP